MTAQEVTWPGIKPTAERGGRGRVVGVRISDMSGEPVALRAATRFCLFLGGFFVTELNCQKNLMEKTEGSCGGVCITVIIQENKLCYKL